MDEKRLKMAVIAGASRALKYKEEHPRANDCEILQHITRDVRKIVEEIDGD